MGAACRPSVKTLCFELALAADGVDPDSPCIATTPAEGSLHDKPPGQSHSEDKQSNDMKSFRKELWFEVPSRFGFVNITDQVEACLRESRIAEGLVLVNAMHITGSVFINDDESDCIRITFPGWKDWRRTTPPLLTCTIAQAKTMPMPT